MLFKAGVLDGIRKGGITLAFRCWSKPSVRTGSRIRTAIGIVEVTAIAPVRQTDIKDKDARKAGFASRDELLASLRAGPGQVYRIALRLAGADPRVALRNAKPSADELKELAMRLARMDAARARPWTLPLLQMIADYPAHRAQDLADKAGRELRLFKADVRKLKDLGLTESLDTGYRLSPRGRAAMIRLKRP
jgi:hypothetical protein